MYNRTNNQALLNYIFVVVMLYEKKKKKKKKSSANHFVFTFNFNLHPLSCCEISYNSDTTIADDVVEFKN